MKTTRINILQKIKLAATKFYFKNKPVDRNDWIRFGVLAISIPVFLYSAGQLGYKLFTYVYEDYLNSKVVELKPEPEKNPFDDIKIEEEDLVKGLPYKTVIGKDSRLNEAGRLVEYEGLWKRNNDLVGWLNMPGFKKDINYPILYSGDNSYYLLRDYDKHDSRSGSLFLDGSNIPYHVDPLDIDRNYVIYGHAMYNMSMFGQLTDYWNNKDAWANKKTIFIDLMNTRLEYEVVSTFLVDPNYNYRQTKFADDVEYKKYLDQIIAKSVHDFGAKLDVKDKLITLSTCYKSTRRTAIIGRLVRQIVYIMSSDNNLPSIPPLVLPTNVPHDLPMFTPTPLPTSAVSITPGPGKTPTPALSPKPSVTVTTGPSPTGGITGTPTPTPEPTATPTDVPVPTDTPTPEPPTPTEIAPE
jgi:sortase B